MQKRKHLFAAGFLLALTFAFAAPSQTFAKPSEYEKIVRHLKSNYKAKKVSLGFVWLARVAVKIVRPAGVKSFNVTLFKDLQFSKENVDIEMQQALRQSFGPEWTSVFRARSHGGEQAYMYMREDGKDVKLTVVTIDKQNAAVVRARFSPEKLAEFINNPRIFGISLSDGNKLPESTSDQAPPASN